MGWYSQGTQVVDFTENADGTIDFKEAGYFIPENANKWVSHVFKVAAQPRRHRSPTGARPATSPSATAGRNAIDVYKVTPAGAARSRAAASCPGRPTTRSRTRRAPPRCASSLGFGSARAKPRGRGLRVRLHARAPATRSRSTSSAPPRGRRVTGERRVARFDRRRARSAGTARGRRVRDGYYVVRFAVRAPNGRTDFRRVALRRRDGRFRSLPAFFRGKQCTLVQTFKLARPVFGGTKRRALGIAFRLGPRRARDRHRDARGKVVKRFKRRATTPGAPTG